MKIKKKNKRSDNLNSDNIIDDLKFENKFLRGLCIAFILCYGVILFLSKAHALTMYERTSGSYPISVDENYILSQIGLVDNNFNISDYPNITCNIDGTSLSGGWYDTGGVYHSSGVQTSMKIRCIFMSDTYINSITGISRTVGTSYNRYEISTIVNPPNNVCNYYVLLGVNSSGSSSNSSYTGYFQWGCLTSGGGNPYSVQSRTLSGSNLTNNLNTNFDIANFSYETNNLDFSSTITYNPSYLEDNPNFQKVCLNNQNQSFSIIPDTYDTSDDFDILSFFLGSSYLQNISMNVLEFDSTGATKYLVENSADWDTYPYYKADITDEVLSGGGSIADELVVGLFKQAYPNLFPNLYGYSLFLTTFKHQSSTGVYSLPVFRLEDAYTLSPYCIVVDGSTVCETANGQWHGGGGRVHGTVNEPSQDTCFYIPTNTHLKVWQMNDFNDISDIISIDGVDININTDTYEDIYLFDMTNNEYSGFIGYLKSVLDTCSVPIAFINGKITAFFNGLPLIIQYLVISIIFVLLFISLVKFLTGGK